MNKLVPGLALLLLASTATAQIGNRRSVDAAPQQQAPSEAPARPNVPPPPAQRSTQPAGDYAAQAPRPTATENPAETKFDVVFEPTASLPTEVLNRAEPVVEKTAKGEVNWSRQYVEAEGVGIINTERFKVPAQARAAAKRAAVVDAQRNLLEVVQGVHVTSETTVQDMMLESDFVTTRVNGVVKGAEEVGRAREEDGAIKVRLRMPLYSQNSVATAIYDAVPEAKPLPGPIDNSAPAGSQQTAAQSPADAQATAAKPLAFNVLNSKGLDPALFPVVYDKDGKVAFDMKKVFDPSKGAFPQVIQAGSQIMRNAGLEKQAQIVDVVLKEGKLVLADTKGNDTWRKIGQTAAKVGKFLLMLL